MEYLLKNKRVKLFVLVLISAAIVISLTLVRNSTFFTPLAFSQSTIQYLLKPGWNLVTIPYTGYSAQKLCSGYEIASVATRVNGFWDKYDCQNPAVTNFPILPNQAYFLRNDSPDNYPISLTGRENSRSAKPILGWNSFFTKTDTYRLASDFCASSPFPNFEVSAVSRWAFGDWNEYNCEGELNNFPIMKDNTYFLRLSSLDSTNGTTEIQLLTTPE